MRTSLIFVIVAGLGTAILVGAIITTVVVLVSRSRPQSNAVASAPQVSELNQS